MGELVLRLLLPAPTRYLPLPRGLEQRFDVRHARRVAQPSVYHVNSIGVRGRGRPARLTSTSPTAPSPWPLHDRVPALASRMPVLVSRVPVLASHVPVLGSHVSVLGSRVPVLVSRMAVLVSHVQVLVSHVLVLVSHVLVLVSRTPVLASRVLAQCR